MYVTACAFLARGRGYHEAILAHWGSNMSAPLMCESRLQECRERRRSEKERAFFTQMRQLSAVYDQRGEGADDVKYITVAKLKYLVWNPACFVGSGASRNKKTN